MSERSRRGVSAERTQNVEARLRESGFFEEPNAEAPRGYYNEKGGQKRRIVGRDTPINQGIYLGSGQREAIVIDDEKDPALHYAYEDVLMNLEELREQGQLQTEQILKRVYHMVRGKIPFDDAVAQEIERIVGPDGRVALGSYIAYGNNRGGGVCRHEALLAGYVIERLIKDKRIGNIPQQKFGRVSVDRNTIAGKGGHAWVRYEDENNEPWILDAAQEYCGKLKDVPVERWFYERLPESEKGR